MTTHRSKNPPIISFQHCDSLTDILCFDRVPPICPVCGGQLAGVPDALPFPPFRIPPVLVNATSKPFCLVIKPTDGTFLQSYVPGQYLHAGITSSMGTVFNFDERGVHQDTTSWEQSVVIPLLSNHDYEMKLQWDSELEQYSLSEDWEAEMYLDETHNCFDFVVGFLNHVQYNQTVKDCHTPLTREELIKGYIVTMTTRAADFIRIHRTIRQNGYVMQRQQDR
ncbi:MKRN2 opposite strand protein-like [Diadema setosum]|uniref:MKRN2 opposite strand protein-like n=1 Tax=Diadema setosum TaxID=31175 RepID=UPI003B3AABAF